MSVVFIGCFSFDECVLWIIYLILILSIRVPECRHRNQ